ncbi:MAG: SARP family transcriptional regulator, partial [Lachnospiraceae bacterium]|nr:SARP family transcriptional regulator [Lachnospiraceae bacterium]
MKDRIQIKMLGEFSLTCGGQVVSDKDNRSKKVWTLLEYLIAFHSMEISRETLLKLLWPNAESSIDSENALKTILHRARTALDSLGYTEHRLILHRRGSYQWNNSADFELDIDLFREACTAAADPELSAERQLQLCYDAFHLYHGRFLPKSMDGDWAIPVAEYYHSLYIGTVHNMIELLLSGGQYEEVIRIAGAASAIDPYDEPLHYHLIRSLYMTGQRREAMDRYHKVLRLFYDRFG